MAIESPVPKFEVLSKSEARMLPPRRARRDWKPLIDALADGAPIWSADITDADVKYLTLVFNYRRKGFRLRSRRESRNSLIGRTVWVEKVP